MAVAMEGVAMVAARRYFHFHYHCRCRCRCRCLILIQNPV
jgi:hypothetical protein